MKKIKTVSICPHCHPTTRMLRLERTMNLLEGGKEGKGGWGERVGRGWREGGEGTWGREGG